MGEGGGLNMGATENVWAVNVRNNIIQHNEANTVGGGIYCNNCSGEIIGNTIKFNTTNVYGGGIYFNRGAVVWTGNTISQNHARANGGGVSGKDIPGWPTLVPDENGNLTLLHYAPCFPISGNTIELNTHGTIVPYPGPDGGWCPDSGYDIYPHE
jgi:hypothetical protein